MLALLHNSLTKSMFISSSRSFSTSDFAILRTSYVDIEAAAKVKEVAISRRVIIDLSCLTKRKTMP